MVIVSKRWLVRIRFRGTSTEVDVQLLKKRQGGAIFPRICSFGRTKDSANNLSKINNGSNGSESYYTELFNHPEGRFVCLSVFVKPSRPVVIIVSCTWADMMLENVRVIFRTQCRSKPGCHPGRVTSDVPPFRYMETENKKKEHQENCSGQTRITGFNCYASSSLWDYTNRIGLLTACAFLVPSTAVLCGGGRLCK